MTAAAGKMQSQWEQMSDFVLRCGNTCDPNQLVAEIMDGIGQFCRFDTASAYLLDKSGNICGQHLRNVADRWSKIYLAYYINTDDQRYSLFRKAAIGNPSGKLIMKVYDWEHENSEEFVPDFVRARGLKYTCGFGLFDLHHNLRASISLDRTQGENFSEEELQTLWRIIPHLNNLHKNFFYQGSSSRVVKQAALATSLTVRETQIAELLCQSASPAEISRTLHIAQSTTYKHIANIYQKMNISSQRELLACLLHQED